MSLSGREATAFDYLHYEILNSYGKGTRVEGLEGAEVDPPEEEVKRLEKFGYDVGCRLIERLTKDIPHFKTQLEAMKFICKDFWELLFGKQVNKLSTNYQGVYVLQDTQFALAELCMAEAEPAWRRAAMRCLILPSGIIKGALASLGVKCTIQVEFSAPATCKFNIHTMQAR